MEQTISFPGEKFNVQIVGNAPQFLEYWLIDAVKKWTDKQGSSEYFKGEEGRKALILNLVITREVQ